MKIGDLVRCIETDFGIGIIVKKRPFGGFIVCFPNSEITHSDKCVGISRGNLEVIDENR
tara:strand:+ start:50 stop:226 length:177 start_codon:yes stop_codon:yes gene_type:complete